MAVLVTNPSSVYRITITNAGSGYSVSDELTIGAGSATITVTGVGVGGEITTFDYKARGSGYTTGAVSLSGGTGSSATATVDSLCSTFATANSWYTVEAHMLNGFGTGEYTVADRRTIPVTFANTGNCKGVMFYARGRTNSPVTVGLRADLQEAVTATFTIASPGVVNIVGHGLNDGDDVMFTSTGTLPTGISNTVTYYVRNKTADTFNVSTTPTGALSNFTGTPSGTASCWINRVTSDYAETELIDVDPLYTTGYNYGFSSYAFAFTKNFNYPVDTTANKWRFALWNSGTPTGGGNLVTFTAINGNPVPIAYATWCDNTATFADGDVVILKDRCLVDANVTLGTVTYSSPLPTTNTAISGVCCAVLDPKAETVPLQWDYPQGAYTLTIPAGFLLMSARSGLSIGKSYARITQARQAKIDINTAGGFSIPAGGAFNNVNKQFWYTYGEEATKFQATTTASEVAVGATSLTTTDAMSWAIGDTFNIGTTVALSASGTLANRQSFTITNISGTTIDFTPAIQTGMNRVADASVIYTGDMPIHIACTALKGISFGFSESIFQYTKFLNIANLGQSLGQQSLTNYWGLAETVSFDKGTTFYKCQFINTTSSMNVSIGLIQRKDWVLDTCYFSNARPLHIVQGLIVNWFTSGKAVVKNCIVMHMYTNNSIAQSTITGNGASFDIRDNRFEVSDEPWLALNGYNSILKNNVFTCCRGYTAQSAGAITLNQILAMTEFSGNKIDNCRVGLQFNTLPIVDLVIDDLEVGQTIPCTVADIEVLPNGFFTAVLNNPKLQGTLATSNITTTINGTQLSMVSLNTANNDTVYKTYGILTRTGDGLTDTSAYNGLDFTGGSGLFALKLTPTDSTNLLQYLPYPNGKLIANQQNKIITVHAIIKIKNAGYYAGTHTLPRLRVTVDGGLTTQTTSASATTDQQTLTVNITPTTTNGRLDIYIEGATDATGTDGEVLIGHTEVKLPDGTAIDNTRLAYWSEGLPLPPDTTIPTPQTNWVALTAVNYGTGSMGEKLKEITPAERMKLIIGGEIPIY